MSAPTDMARDWKRDALFLLPCLAVALGVRLFFFNGPSLHDDVNYWLQAIATGLGGAWPPEKTHWHTRIGFILPCALLLKMFGLKIWVPYTFTMLGGLLEVALTFLIAREFVPENAARLAAWLCVFFPLNILYSSYLYVDIWAGIFGALSLFFWYRALKWDAGYDYALASLFFGLGWLFHETVVMNVPIYLALWWQMGQRWRLRLLWLLPPGLLIILAEFLLYQITTGNWHFRLDVIFSNKIQMTEDFANDHSFLLTPFIRLFTSHQLGLFLVAGLLTSVLNFHRMPKPLVLWLLVGFGWRCWGTSSPAAWLPLDRDPRYWSILTIPCLTVLAVAVMNLRRGWCRGLVVTILIGSGLLGASLDLGHVKLTAYRRFADSEYNQPATALEPFVYFGVRATQGFSPAAARFSCVNDLGRLPTVEQMGYLPGTRLTNYATARYLTFSVQTLPEKWQTKVKEGWREVAAISGARAPARERVKSWLGKLDGQIISVSSTPELIVLENPAFMSKTNATLQAD